MKNIVFLCCAVVVTIFSGCTASVASFDKSDYSAVAGNVSSVQLSSSCFEDKKSLPLLYAAGGKLIFDLIIEDSKTKLEGLKKASIASYSDRLIVSSKKFKDAKCVLLSRKAKGDATAGITSILEIKHYGDNGFTLHPIYVRAINTAAITKNPERGKEAKIDVSYAVAVKAIGINKDTGLPAQYILGSGVTTVPNVSVGPDSNSSCPEGCKESGLIPVLSSEHNISMTFAVTESGKLGINIDKRTGQLDAIKEAIGPAVQAEIAAKYADD